MLLATGLYDRLPIQGAPHVSTGRADVCTHTHSAVPAQVQCVLLPHTLLHHTHMQQIRTWLPTKLPAPGMFTRLKAHSHTHECTHMLISSRASNMHSHMHMGICTCASPYSHLHIEKHSQTHTQACPGPPSNDKHRLNMERHTQLAITHTHTQDPHPVSHMVDSHGHDKLHKRHLDSHTQHTHQAGHTHRDKDIHTGPQPLTLIPPSLTVGSSWPLSRAVGGSWACPDSTPAWPQSLLRRPSSSSAGEEKANVQKYKRKAATTPSPSHRTPS